MGTTYLEDSAHYAHVMADFEEKGGGTALSDVQLAGVHWAVARKSHGSVVDRQVLDAFKEAAALLNAGYLKASAALRSGDEEAKLLMTKWFGKRHRGGGGGFDTWLGVKRILGQLQVKLARPIRLYYRGEDSLIGKPDDYPGAAGNLTAQDVRGYAESGAGDTDGVIGLCKLFFEKGDKGNFTMNRKGFDSIGGTIVHELSHNYCETEDHEGMDGQDCYGTGDCLLLARKRAIRAWYNADNIEYFCEECGYGIVAAKVSIATGGVSSVSNLRNAQQQLIEQLKPKAPVKNGVPNPGGNVQQLHQNLVAVAKNPTLKPPVQTGAGSGVSKLKELWGG